MGAKISFVNLSVLTGERFFLPSALFAAITASRVAALRFLYEPDS
jgi:hypothetical protein